MPLAPLLAVALFAAPQETTADELAFLARLRQALPMEAQVSRGMGAPGPEKLIVSMPEPMILQFSGGGMADRRLVFKDEGGYALGARWDDPPSLWRLDEDNCRAGMAAPDRLEIECYSPRAMQSRARLPPSMVMKIHLTPDGPRIVQDGVLRTVYSPWGMPQASRGLEAGPPAVLADALRQLAEAPEGPGLLSGGASNRKKEWFGTMLKVTAVRGLDFRLERYDDLKRAGSEKVRADWSFDYQGLDARDRSVLVWRVRRQRPGTRPLDLWCLGRERQGGIGIDCHDGKGPDLGRKEADRAVGFLMLPFPEWRLNVLEGLDEPFATAGSRRLEPRPFP